MDLFESSTQSFIVKIWIEETAEEAGRVIWRGHIIHVLSGEREYFENLGDILRFMETHLKSIGIVTGRKKSWLKRCWPRYAVRR